MAQPQLKAQFFVAPGGLVTPKAPPIPRTKALEIFKRDLGICRVCGVATRFGGNTVAPFGPVPCAVDHIFPRSRGGQNNDNNLRLLCITCNSRKGAK